MPGIGISGLSATRTSITARIIFACQACRAPGVFSTDPAWREAAPGCFVEVGDPRAWTDIGPTCPNCGEARTVPDQDLGEIAAVEYD